MSNTLVPESRVIIKTVKRRASALHPASDSEDESVFSARARSCRQPEALSDSDEATENQVDLAILSSKIHAADNSGNDGVML